MRTILSLATALALTGFALGASAAPPAPNLSTAFDKPVLQVQGRACRVCRRDCYYDYRTSCGYSQSCRTAFTQCMRGCWEDYCR